MARLKKAQAGKTVSYPVDSSRLLFGKKYAVKRTVDTTGYAAGKRKEFPASDELMRNKEGKRNPTKTGTLSRKGVQKGLESMQKKKGGKVPKAQYGRRSCGPGGCRQSRGMSGYGGGYSPDREAFRAERQARREERKARRQENPGLLRRIFGGARKTGGKIKKSK